MSQDVTGVEATLALKEAQEKNRRAERITVVIAVSIVGMLFLLALVPAGVVDDAANAVSYYEQGGEVSRNAARNCKDPRNRNTAYCLERSGQADQDWRSISRFQDGKANQFTLHHR